MAKASDTPHKIIVPMDERPRCTHRGCNEPGQIVGTYRKDGYPLFRKLCSIHHSKKTAKRHGMKSLAEVVAAKQGMTVAEYSYSLLKRRADKEGMTVVDYINSKHPYRKHRKSYCENRDGRLGFKCRYKILHSAQLEVDHINGNPKDHREKNLQTLCNNCHCYKTHMNKDYATPGRKALAQNKMFTKLLVR
jgi:hypothetical protein